MKKKIKIHGIIVLLVPVVAGCASYQKHIEDIGSRQGDSLVTGTVTYRVRMILPTDALVCVDLVDVSRQGAPPLIIGLQEIETKGRQIPIPFEIGYRPVDIDRTHVYAVQARILQGERLLFTNTTTYKVINNGVVSNIEVIVEQMPRE